MNFQRYRTKELVELHYQQMDELLELQTKLMGEQLDDKL